jgi:RNA polymerase sigma-70 factor (ECF subfamily)
MAFPFEHGSSNASPSRNAARCSGDRLSSSTRRLVGEWLPEPLVASADDDLARKGEMADSLSLRPDRGDRRHERAERPPARHTRPPPRVLERRPRFEASREQREQLATRFFAAAEEGDREGLEELLAHDARCSAATAAARYPPSNLRSTAAPPLGEDAARDLRWSVDR